MEMKKAQHPSRIFRASLAFGLLLVCAQFSSPVSAEEFLCQATQASEKELPMLEKTCPIGNGVWGKKVPQGGNYLYWIQCGLLPKPMSLAKAKPLYSKITTDVWMKPESQGYRCLIGPYKDLSDARGICGESKPCRITKRLSSAWLEKRINSLRHHLNPLCRRNQSHLRLSQHRR